VVSHRPLFGGGALIGAGLSLLMPQAATPHAVYKFDSPEEDLWSPFQYFYKMYIVFNIASDEPDKVISM
jgi:hypothetical protein